MGTLALPILTLSGIQMGSDDVLMHSHRGLQDEAATRGQIQRHHEVPRYSGVWRSSFSAARRVSPLFQVTPKCTRLTNHAIF